MEEFQYKKGILLVLSKWKYIAISILVAFFISILIFPNLHKEKYIATVSIALGAIDYENLGDNLDQNAQLIFNYNSLIKSDALVYEIIEKNNYDFSVSEVQSMIETEILEDTTIINIKVENDDEEVARQILSDIVEKLKENSRNIYFVDNIYILRDILIKNDENFNLLVMIISLTAFGGIASIAIIAILLYFKKVVIIEKNEHKILNIDVLSKLSGRKKSELLSKILRRKQKNDNMPYEFNNVYLFFNKKKSKVIGILGDKYCKYKERIIIDLCKFFNKKVLIVKFGRQKSFILNRFLVENDFKKRERKFDNSQEEGENKYTIELLTSKSNKIEVLNFKNASGVMDLVYDPSNIDSLKKMFEKYEYVFIDLDNKDNVETEIFCELCDTILILSKNYVSKEKNLIEIKEVCSEKNIANLGVILI